MIPPEIPYEQTIMKKDRILLLGGNFYPETTGIGKYNGEMIDWLSSEGYECGVLTTYPYYPHWKVQPPYERKSNWFRGEKRCLNDCLPIKIYRCPHYVPKIPTGEKRILSDISFFLTAFIRLFILLFQKKYDYVIVVAPPFQLGLLGLVYKKIRGAKMIYHIQDLQIDAAQELGMIKSTILLRMMFGLEKFILRHTNFISSISEGMIRKIKSKYNKPVILFPNWVDTDAFHPLFQSRETREQFNFLSTDKIILYSGAIGEKQGLQILLHSAKDLKSHQDIKFIICGSGPYKQCLMDMAREMELTNVFFIPLQPSDQFNQFLNMADVHLVLQKGNANDLVMPSKLTTILSVGGLALVTAEPDTSLHFVVHSNNIGIISEPDNSEALTISLLKAVDHPHIEIRKNAREFAENNLTKHNVVLKFFSHIMS